MTILFQPHAAKQSIIVEMYADRPPGWFLVAKDLTNTESPESAEAILILSPSRAPPLFGEEGSTARTATLSPLLDQ